MVASNYSGNLYKIFLNMQRKVITTIPQLFQLTESLAGILPETEMQTIAYRLPQQHPLLTPKSL